MPRLAKPLLILALTAVLVGCSTARNQARGFRLAANGDPDRGKAAFLEFGCTACHEIQGTDLPRATVQPVLLGGQVMVEPSDGYLVTAIINPAYHAAAYPAKGHPPMPDFAGRMTVQQLTDIVAYLQLRYTLSPLPGPGRYR